MTDYRMLNDNLIKDFDNLIKIPQNPKSLFRISYDTNYKKSVEIFIKHDEEVDLLNLYLIIKSFTKNLEYLPSSVLLTIKNLNEQSFVTFHRDVGFFKNITFAKFAKWFAAQLKNDEHYLHQYGLYSFVIIFKTNKETSFLKPNYPWKNEILEIFWKNLNEEIETDKIIEEKNLIIEDLKKKLSELQIKLDKILNSK